MIIDKDCLTGYKVNPGEGYYDHTKGICEYFCKPVGKVIVTLSAFGSLPDDIFKEDRLKLAGICRHKYEKGEIPLIIAEESLPKIFEDYNIPNSFEDKKIILLEYLISKGGKEYHHINLDPEVDFTLVYSDIQEFKRVIRSLEDQDLITIRATSKDGYDGVLPTPKGIKLVESPTHKDVSLSEILTTDEIDEIIALIRLSKYKEAFMKIEDILKERKQERVLWAISFMKNKFNSIQEKELQGIIRPEDGASKTVKLMKKLVKMLSKKP